MIEEITKEDIREFVRLVSKSLDSEDPLVVKFINMFNCALAEDEDNDA